MTFMRIGETGQTAAAKNQNGDGHNAGKTASGIAPRSSSEVAAWLGQQSPRDMDAAAVSRAKSHGVDLEVKTDLRFPVGENGERKGFYEVATGCVVSGTEEQRERALADLRNFETPASVRSIEDWLAELSVLTAGRSREGMDAALTVTAYASRLSKYPADVARAALLDKTWKWWPTWDELHKACEALASPRRHMIHALSQPVRKPEPKRRPPTQEERDRIQAMVDELFPLRSQEMREAAVDEALKGNCMRDEG